MNEAGGRPPHLLHDIVRGAQMVGARPLARLRTGTIVAATALLVSAGVAFPALPVLAHRAAAAAARPMAAMMPAAAPTPSAPTASPGAATASQTPATQLTVGPGTAAGFVQTGPWTAAAGGWPNFTGPDLWVANGGGTARWDLGGPSGGHGWDQVRVMAWIPNMHGLAWVRYTVTSTSMGIATVRTFDVLQEALNGWYTLPAPFAIGTAARRTGTITVGLAYLRPYPPTANAGGAQMAAAQMRFVWS